MAVPSETLTAVLYLQSRGACLRRELVKEILVGLLSGARHVHSVGTAGPAQTGPSRQRASVTSHGSVTTK